MSSVNIKPEALRNRSQQIENLRQKDIESLTKIRALVLNLEEVWRGQAAEAYVNKYLSQQNNLNEFHNTLRDFVDLLNDAANKAESIDSELLGLVNKIS